jgi:predicted nucleic acid-binding protein
VPTGSAAPIICDTGALLDHLVESAPDHARFRQAIDQARTRYAPGLVLAELDYFLRDEREAMRVFIGDLARGAFTYAPPTPCQLSRAMDIDRRFADLRMGLVDASVAAQAELVGVQSPIVGIRRVQLPRTRYHVYYVGREDVVPVLAVWHASVAVARRYAFASHGAERWGSHVRPPACLFGASRTTLMRRYRAVTPPSADMSFSENQLRTPCNADCNQRSHRAVGRLIAVPAGAVKAVFGRSAVRPALSAEGRNSTRWPRTR